MLLAPPPPAPPLGAGLVRNDVTAREAERSGVLMDMLFARLPGTHAAFAKAIPYLAKGSVCPGMGPLQPCARPCLFWHSARGCPSPPRLLNFLNFVQPGNRWKADWCPRDQERILKSTTNASPAPKGQAALGSVLRAGGGKAEGAGQIFR